MFLPMTGVGTLSTCLLSWSSWKKHLVPSSCPVSLLSKCPMMGLPARRFCFCCSLNTFKSYSSSFGKKRTSTLLSGVLTRQNRVLAFTSSPSSAMMCTGKTGECRPLRIFAKCLSADPQSSPVSVQNVRECRKAFHSHQSCKSFVTFFNTLLFWP